MAVPDEIPNNSLLVSAKIRAWTDWLNAGKGIKSDTMINLKAIAVASSTEPFICIDTDTKTALIYMGDVGVGQDGFVVLGGGEWS